MIAILLAFTSNKARSAPISLYVGDDAQAARDLQETPPAGIARTELFLNPQYTRRRTHEVVEGVEYQAPDPIFSGCQPEKIGETLTVQVSIADLPQFQEFVASVDQFKIDFAALKVERDALKETEAAYNTLTIQFGALQTRADSLQDDLTAAGISHAAELARLTKERDDLQAQFDAAKVSFEADQQALAERDTRIVELEGTVASLRQQLTEALATNPPAPEPETLALDGGDPKKTTGKRS